MKRCLVVYALPERQYLWPVELPDGASVREALAAARELVESGGAQASAPPAQSSQAPQAVQPAQMPRIPWNDAAVGIFGEPCDRSAIPRDGDRIEIYRPLLHDPKQTRRERARRGRR